MKRFALILLAAAMTVALAGCGGGSAVNNKTSDENIEITVNIPQSTFTPKGESTEADIIPVTFTIKNLNKEQSIYIVKGSSSNAVPDGLQVNLADFANLYTPEVGTMDYGITEIKPGQSASHTLPFVPYIPAEGVRNAFGFDKNISFFRSLDFTPAPKGTAQGTFTLSYAIPDGDSEVFMITDATAMRTLEGFFTVTIA